MHKQHIKNSKNVLPANTENKKRNASAGLIHLKQPISWTCEHLFRIQHLIFLKRTQPLQFKNYFFKNEVKELPHTLTTATF